MQSNYTENLKRLSTETGHSCATQHICEAAELYGMKAGKRPDPKSAWSPAAIAMPKSRHCPKRKRPDAGIPSSRPRIGANPPRPRRPFIGQVISAS